MILNRRRFMAGAGLLLAAPAIVRVESLMQLPRRRWQNALLGEYKWVYVDNGQVMTPDFWISHGEADTQQSHPTMSDWIAYLRRVQAGLEEIRWVNDSEFTRVFP